MRVLPEDIPFTKSILSGFLSANFNGFAAWQSPQDEGEFCTVGEGIDGVLWHGAI
jgi:hypothetical protein